MIFKRRNTFAKNLTGVCSQVCEKRRPLFSGILQREEHIKSFLIFIAGIDEHENK